MDPGERDRALPASAPLAVDSLTLELAFAEPQMAVTYNTVYPVGKRGRPRAWATPRQRHRGRICSSGSSIVLARTLLTTFAGSKTHACAAWHLHAGVYSAKLGSMLST